LGSMGAKTNHAVHRPGGDGGGGGGPWCTGRTLQRTPQYQRLYDHRQARRQVRGNNK